jgi:hypothetical protein
VSKLEVFISSRTKQGEGRLGGESKMLMLKELLLALKLRAIVYFSQQSYFNARSSTFSRFWQWQGMQTL